MAGLGTELHCSESVKLQCSDIAELDCSDNVGPHPAVGARDYTSENGDAPSHYHGLHHLLPDSQASGYLPYRAQLHSLLTRSYSSRPQPPKRPG